MNLSEPRRLFVHELFQELQLTDTDWLSERREREQLRMEAVPQIRAVADKLTARELLPEHFRAGSERLAFDHKLFGFAGVQGQMFLNQLVYAARDANLSDELGEVLGQAIRIPPNLDEAKKAIDRVAVVLEKLRQTGIKTYGSLGLKRIPYLLSYFWEAGARDEFPIMYPSSQAALDKLGFVTEWPISPAESYRLFHQLFDEVRTSIQASTWDTESFFVWINDRVPFPGIDPGDFDRLGRNATINQQFVPAQGYPDPELARDAKVNIDAVLRHLKLLCATLKPEVSKLFRTEPRVAAAGPKSSWAANGRYRDEAWASFNSRTESYYEPSLQVGLTPGGAYWGFHFGSAHIDVRSQWKNGQASFDRALASGARLYLLPLDGEPSELGSQEIPQGTNHRGALLGWVTPKGGQILQHPRLVRQIGTDFALFGAAVHRLIDTDGPIVPPDGADVGELELIGALGPETPFAGTLANHRDVLDRHGRLAWWWSFGVRTEFADRLRPKPFLLNIYRDKVIVARYRVVDWRTSDSSDGIASPWPDVTPTAEIGKTSLGESRSAQFRTWFLIDRIDEADGSLNLNAFEFVDSHLKPTPSHLRGSFAYVIAADADPWEVLARTIYRETRFVLVLQQLVNERKQIIFYGPPGTGKTFVAKAFAQTLIAGRGDVELVQFHPSYSYEEFVEGLRPVPDGGGLRYETTPGRLRRFAERAAADEDGTYVLIIDEINRANLSKVFGELFFLLEYRGEQIRLPYSGILFSLPSNLFIIGTMNTADRSIALVDFALRRRFAFVGFYPDEDLRELRAYLAENEKEEYSYVVDMLVAVNKAITDRDYRLGHSYFMLTRPDLLDDERIERTWTYSIEPYLREYWYDDQSIKVEDYTFEVLRKRVTPTPLPGHASSGTESDADSTQPA